MSGERRILMNPGPVSLSDRVRRALDAPDLCHREAAYSTLQRELREALCAVHPSSSAPTSAVLLTGSGTAAVEAMLGSLVPRDGHALVVSNGVYGERMAAVLDAARRPAHLVRGNWEDGIDLHAVERALDAHPEVGWLATVHHETTTGRLNDLDALGALCRRRGVSLLLDAVSSFGAEKIDWEGWNLEACAATANKCLHGVPGVSFVIARESAFEARSSGSASVYLDLFAHRDAQDAGHPLFTPAVHVSFALAEALREHADAGGWRGRRAHYRALSKQLREGLAAHGIAAWLEPAGLCASSLSAFALPEGVAFDTLADRLAAAGFVIYPGQGPFGGRIFRLAVMGEQDGGDIQRFLAAFEACGFGAQASAS